jgi:type IV pilus assembly protein PilA
MVVTHARSTLLGSRRATRGRRSEARETCERAFTLIELMVTVGIVGVLAVLAYAGYHKFVVASHQTEANNMLAGIKNRQETYRAETGQYMNLSKALASNQGTGFSSLYPHCQSSIAAPGAFKVSWSPAACTAACCNSGTDWKKLKVESSAPTYYGFTTVAGSTGIPSSTITIGGHSPNFPAANVIPWFVATAVGDTDGNGVFSTVMISSFDNTVYVDNENE